MRQHIFAGLLCAAAFAFAPAPQAHAAPAPQAHAATLQPAMSEAMLIPTHVDAAAPFVLAQYDRRAEHRRHRRHRRSRHHRRG